ncbi:MAG TPA: hypothetical protein VKB59_09970 [Micromonosporaceae bacterium]|jgi:hypothetical protein|nr:hypothetical protein [Micromonosporaceae bacterium]HKE64957.1 hypothetical protein [Micromonosporaceae bacterium]
MISRLFGAMFTPKYPRGYTGRHRANDGQARSRAVPAMPPTSTPTEQTAAG